MPELDPEVQRCRDAMRVLALTHPYYLVPFARVRHLLHVVNAGVETMAVFSSGRIVINRAFAASLRLHELAGVLCHELLHLVLQHHARAEDQDAAAQHRSNCAADMCINRLLLADGLTLPEGALLLPYEYRGPVVTESVERWLVKHPEFVPPRQLLLSGCSVTRDGRMGVLDEDGNLVTWAELAQQLRLAAAACGAARMAGLLEPRPARLGWRRVLRHGATRALANPGREERTMARLSRRRPPGAPLLPGWRGGTCRVCVLADVSGSMGGRCMEQIYAECRSLLREFPGLRLYFIAHTAEVEWEGVVDQGSAGLMEEALLRTGGTNPEPAYAAARAQGYFDALIHFTDGEFGGTAWPQAHARQLVVARFGEGGLKAPDGALELSCTEPE